MIKRIFGAAIVNGVVLLSCGCEQSGSSIMALGKTFENRFLWVETMPVQCLDNSWQQDWLRNNGGQDLGYPVELDQQIITEFFKRQGAAIVDSQVDQLYEAVCASCSCPTGKLVFLRIHQVDYPIFAKNGFRVSGQNLALTINRDDYSAGDTVEFQLSNDSRLSFESSGYDPVSQFLQVTPGSGFQVQRLENGFWSTVESLRLDIPPVEFTIKPAETLKGRWFAPDNLDGIFRLVLLSSAVEGDSRIVHTISNRFVINDSAVPFDPQPRELEFGDPYTIWPENTFLAGDTLRFRISHSGGCENHDYVVYLNRVEDLTAYLFVHHNANGDLCEAYLTYDLNADLRELLVRDDFSAIKLVLPDSSLIHLRD